MSGTGVPAGFKLPWNTTRTMADVWAPSFEAHKRGIAERTAKQRRKFVADYQRRQAERPPVTIAASGKIAYAGYDGEKL